MQSKLIVQNFNNMKYIVFALFFLASCSNPTPNQKAVDTPVNDSGKFVHTVFFKLKPDADIQVLLKSLETFKTVDVIKKVEIGTFQDTGNPASALTEYGVTVKMTFDDLAAFRVYEKHPVHLASIEATKNLMAAPPIGYDYIVK